MNLDDFKHLLSHVEIKAESKKPPEHEEDAKLRRFKDKFLFMTTITAIAFFFIVCVLIIFGKRESILSNLALNGIMSLTTGLAGYYLRGNSK